MSTSLPAPPMAPPPVSSPRTANFWNAFFARSTWREFLYHWVALFLAPFGFAYLWVTIGLGAGLAVTFFGLFVSAWLIVGARGWGRLHRTMVRSMLDTEIAEPSPLRRVRGRFSWFRTGWADAAGWRALIHLFIGFFLSIVGFVLSVTFFFVGWGGLTHWFWSRFLPLQQAPDGSWHRGASFGDSYFIDTPGRQVLLAVVCLFILLFVWPALTHAFAHLQRLLAQSLLGPTSASRRVEYLEHSRGRAVDDAEDKLRRIERDLHDGTQARLVALAMKLGDAKERLAAGEDPAQVGSMLDAAHGTAKDALVELRDLARGIHPPVLDNGIGPALATLGANASLPVIIHDRLKRRPSKSIEGIAYFCVAELTTNAVKHAQATQVEVLVDERRGRLFLRVGDDGRGGAFVATPHAGGHSGLAGLQDRVRSVDGSLIIDSPAGGPTIITIDLPFTVLS